MKQIYKEEELEIPWVDTRHERPQDPTADLEFDASREGVTVAVKARVITVTGPRGTLQKNLQHLNMSIRVLAPSDKAVTPVHKVKLVVWHGARKHVACLRTVRSIIENMVTGVRYGFAYKMRLVYAHFPINVIIADDKQSVEIRWVPLGCASSCSPADASDSPPSNFLGEKRVRNVKMLEGVTISESKAQKDEIIVEGNDVDMVSQSAADIHGQVRCARVLGAVFGRAREEAPRPPARAFRSRAAVLTAFPSTVPREGEGHPQGE